MDNSLRNSDWVKASSFDFPSVKNLADFERAMLIPSEPLARRTKLASYAGMAWFPVAPDDIRHAIIEAARQQDLVKMLKSKGLSALEKSKLKDDVFMLLVAEKLSKVSFGGDRSEAGRFAANQRWKNHQKKEDDKKGQSNKSPVAQSILEANESLKKAGLTVRVMEITKRDTELSQRLTNSIEKSATIIRKSKNFAPFTQERWFSEAVNLMKSSVYFEDTEYNYRNPDPVGQFIILVEKGKAIVGAMRFAPDSFLEGFKHLQEGEIPSAGSLRVVKGVGTAMFGEALKIAARTGTGKIKIEALNTAESFWKSQGFKRVKNAKLKENSTYDMIIDADTVQTLVKEISS